MQSRYKNKKNSKASKTQSVKKIFLLTAISALFFVILSSENIKAQIASIISEDGDGIVGITSLMNATINNDPQGVQFFAKNGGSVVVNQKNIGGATALHIASRTGNIEVVKILIENGANVNATDNEGWTPLMRASISNSPELVGILLQSGADASKTNSFGETAIIHSTSAECLECLERLFSNYNFVDNLDYQTLRNQISSSTEIANNKNNVEIQSILKDYATKELSKAGNARFAQNQNNNNEIIVRSLDDEEPMKTPYGVHAIPNRVPLDLPSRTYINNQNKKNASVVTKPGFKLVTNKGQLMEDETLYNKSEEHSNRKYKFLGEAKPSLPIKKVNKTIAKKKISPESKPLITTNSATVNTNGGTRSLSSSISSSIKNEAVKVVDEVKGEVKAVKYKFSGESKNNLVQPQIQVQPKVQ